MQICPFLHIGFLHKPTADAPPEAHTTSRVWGCGRTDIFLSHLVRPSETGIGCSGIPKSLFTGPRPSGYFQSTLHIASVTTASLISLNNQERHLSFRLSVGTRATLRSPTTGLTALLTTGFHSPTNDQALLLRSAIQDPPNVQPRLSFFFSFFHAFLFH
jgi:hypothetical protein